MDISSVEVAEGLWRDYLRYRKGEKSENKVPLGIAEWIDGLAKNDLVELVLFEQDGIKLLRQKRIDRIAHELSNGRKKK